MKRVRAEGVTESTQLYRCTPQARRCTHSTACAAPWRGSDLPALAPRYTNRHVPRVACMGASNLIFTRGTCVCV